MNDLSFKVLKMGQTLSYTNSVKEIWELSTSPWIMPITLLLGFCMLYWLLNIIGFLDLDFLDFDFDGDGDIDLDTDHAGSNFADSILGQALRFMNASEVPLMVVLTVLFLTMWASSVAATSLFNPDLNNLISGVVCVGSFVVSVIAAKLITHPLRPLFKALRRGENDEEPVFGREATVVSLTLDERGGQVEVPREQGAPALLSARLSTGGPVHRGDSVILFAYDDKTTTYLARRIDIKTNNDQTIPN